MTQEFTVMHFGHDATGDRHRQSGQASNEDECRNVRATESQANSQSAGKRNCRCKRNRSMTAHKNTCSIVEIESVEVSHEQLEPLIHILAELLVEERLSELEQSSEPLLKGATICS